MKTFVRHFRKSDGNYQKLLVFSETERGPAKSKTLLNLREMKEFCIPPEMIHGYYGHPFIEPCKNFEPKWACERFRFW